MGIEKPILLDLPGEWASERLVLKPWRDEHVGALFAAIVASKEHLAKWVPWATSYHSLVS